MPILSPPLAGTYDESGPGRGAYDGVVSGRFGCCICGNTEGVRKGAASRTGAWLSGAVGLNPGALWPGAPGAKNCWPAGPLAPTWECGGAAGRMPGIWPMLWAICGVECWYIICAPGIAIAG